MNTSPLEDASLLRLMQLVSPTLPIGAYSYSQGLEAAVEAGWVSNEQTAESWIDSILAYGLVGADLPVLARLHGAWSSDNIGAVEYWNDFLYALRETAELRSEDMHLGRALAKTLVGLDMEVAAFWQNRKPITFAGVFALAAVCWGINVRQALLGYAWTWAENQVAAAIKLVPLGQSMGQRLLTSLIGVIPERIDEALSLPDESLGRSLPGYSLVSMAHEHQYSRMFRS
ncbi:urease accessory protein UreF [Acidihalobacter prosperus]